MIFKKTITIVIALTFIILLNNYFMKTLDNYMKKIDNILEKIEKDFEEKNKNIKTIEELEKVWNEAEKKLAFFIDHEELEKTEIEIYLAKKSMEQENFENAIENISKAKYMLNHMKEKNTLSIINIF